MGFGGSVIQQSCWCILQIYVYQWSGLEGWAEQPSLGRQKTGAISIVTYNISVLSTVYVLSTSAFLDALTLISQHKSYIYFAPPMNSAASMLIASLLAVQVLWQNCSPLETKFTAEEIALTRRCTLVQGVLPGHSPGKACPQWDAPAEGSGAAVTSSGSRTAPELHSHLWWQLEMVARTRLCNQSSTGPFFRKQILFWSVCI